MSAVSKSVAISPPAAAAAGCIAQCPGEQTDYTNGWLRTYTLSASAATGWRFVKFTWDKTRVTQSGSTPQGTGESSRNPSDYNDGVVEQRTDFTATMFQEDLISNVTAIFEQTTPPPHTPTHLLVNSSTAENPAKLVYDPTTNLLVADY
ncbi:MAG: hypothetical protein II265_00340 [Clostridia bacterium]|nr:hypothetical protein [Clostridia bacterium]